MGLSIALSLGCSKSNTDKFADSYCAEVAKCCSQAALPGDGKACHALMAFSADFGSYNSQAGDACLAEVHSQVSAGTFCTDLSSSSQSACDSVYGSSSGSKKPGEDCFFDSDCAPSSSGQVRCASLNVGDNVISKCLVQISGKAGDTPCIGTQEDSGFLSYIPTNPTDVLSQGYVCDVADDLSCQDGTCVALIPVGKDCLISTSCVRTAYCNFPQYVCTPKISAGGDCTGIAGSECVDSAYCDTDALQCKAKLADGATCTSPIVCESGYCSKGMCQSSGLSLLCGD